MRAIRSCALLALLACGYAHAAVAPGQLPPPAMGHTADERAVDLTELRGKVVVISFWATWCAPCMKELPNLAGLQTTASTHHLPLQVVAVNFGESRRQFLHSSRLLMPRLPDLLLTWDRDGVISHPYGVKAIPFMVLLHKDGSVAKIHVGYAEEALQGIIDEINVLVAEPAPPVTAVATTG